MLSRCVRAPRLNRMGLKIPVRTCKCHFVILTVQRCGMQVTQPKASGLAIFQRTALGHSHHCLDICLHPGVLRTATASIYINQMFTWCAASPDVLCDSWCDVQRDR